MTDDLIDKQIEQLAIEVTNESILKLNFHNQLLSEKLRKCDPVVFNSYYLNNAGIDMSRFFFFSQLSFWRTMSLEDWKVLLNNVHDRGAGIYSFFEITYKYLEIDFIKYYLELDSVNNRKRVSFLSGLYRNPLTVLNSGMALELINEFSFSVEEFRLIRANLLEQGAKPAEKVLPGQETKTGVPTALRPSSWDEWFVQLDKGPGPEARLT